MATLYPLRYALVESVRAILFDPCLNRRRIRKIGSNRYWVFVAHGLQQVLRLFRQASGIERKHFDLPGVRADRVQQNHILSPEAAGEGAWQVSGLDFLEI